jgi:hypothetical protein
MPRRTSLLATAAATALAAVLATAAPAAAFPDPVREIEFVESLAYFTGGTTGVGNVDRQLLDERLGWSAEAPTGTGGRTVATAHAGLLSLIDPAYYEQQSFTAAGTITGYVENIALDLYYSSPTTNLCGMGLSIDLTIDGKVILDMEGIGNTADVNTYAAGDDLFVAQVALTDIAKRMEQRGIFGDETTEHAVDLVVQMYPLCQEAIWTYGSAEAPSSLTVNLDPKGSKLKQYTKFDVDSPPAPTPAS